MRALPLLVLVLVALSLAQGGPAGTADASLLLPNFARYAAPAGLASADEAGSPSVGIDWRTDTVLYQAGTRTYRIAMDEALAPASATWLDVTPRTSVVNHNAVAFVDPELGRVFAGGQLGACGVLSFSDNAGATWSPMGNACAGATIDHATLASGPFAITLIGQAWRHAVYYCAHNNGLAQCSTSFDGGLTFRAPALVPCGVTDPGFPGSVTVGHDGAAYVPFRTCGDVSGVAVSRDNGRTWTSSPVPTAVAPATGFDPDVAATTSGWVYMTYPTSTWGVGVALSKDGARTWSDLGDVARAAGVRASAFHEVVAGDDLRATVVYLGSPIGGHPHDPSYLGTWWLYASSTYDGGQTWTTRKVTDDIVQRGWICADGFACDAGRNLLDSIDAQLDARGRLVVAYADGCLAECEAGHGASDDARATLVRQTVGSGVFAALDPNGIGPPDVPVLSVESGDLTVDLRWTTSLEHGAPVTGYRIYRDGALYRTVGLANAMRDTSVEDGREYVYAIAATSDAGPSEPSDALRVLAYLRTIPDAPQNVTATHVQGPKSGKIEVTWQAPADDGHSPITGYRVYRGVTEYNDAFQATVDAAALRFLDRDLREGVVYHYRVTALNAKGESMFSAEATALG